MTRIRNVFVALALLAPVGAVNAEATAVVTIKDFAFQPQVITVATGTTVEWVNDEKRQYHSVWFEQSGEPEPDYIFPGETYERTFDKAGDYPYRCGPHPEMTGTVHVE